MSSRPNLTNNILFCKKIYPITSLIYIHYTRAQQNSTDNVYVSSNVLGYWSLKNTPWITNFFSMIDITVIKETSIFFVRSIIYLVIEITHIFLNTVN